MTNWATEYGNTVETRSEARQQRRALRAQERAKKKALVERDLLFTLWKKWHEERKKKLLGGAWRGPAQELADHLEHMALKDAPALVSLIERGPWRQVDEDTRFLVLELVSAAIVYLRESDGLPPFDDPIPFLDEEPNAFLIIKEMLR